MIEGAIFDADGTLLDSMSIWDRAGEIYLYNLGIEAETNLGQIMFSMTMLEGANYLKDKYKLTYDIDQIQRGINETVEHFYINDVQLKPGVEYFLKALNRSGIPMTIATSSDKPIIEAALTRLSVLKYFKEILTCTIVGRGKDYPDIYYNCARVMNSRPEHTVVFEDAFYAAKTAKTAGFMVAGVYDYSSASKKDRLINITDYYIKDFSTDGTNVLEELL